MSIDYILKSDGIDKDYYMMIVGQDGIMHFANSYLISNLGLTHYKEPRFNFFQLLDSDQLKDFRRELSNVQENRWPVEIELSARNGSLHWIKWQISKFDTNSQSEGKFFCIGYDIVGKSKVKKMHQLANRNYEAIMEGLTVGVIIQDKNGEVLGANRLAARIFDTGFEELYEKNEYRNLWNSAKQNDDPLSFEKSPPMNALQSGVAESNVKIDFQTRSGELRSLVINSQPLFEDNNPCPVSVITSIIDITRTSELEKEIQQLKLIHQKNITEIIFAVQEKERTRIGHELHDNVNQILSTCKLYIEMINTVKPEDQKLKSKVSEYILAAIEEIRRLSKEMVIPQLRENGLVASITKLVEDLKTAYGMNVLFFHEGEIEMLSHGKKVALFRILQEQVKNILKHSKANHLTIHLNADESNITLIIEDDGIGFDSKKTRRGIGLSNIYERTQFYDGDVTVKSAPGKGCKIIVRIPCLS